MEPGRSRWWFWLQEPLVTPGGNEAEAFAHLERFRVRTLLEMMAERDLNLYARLPDSLRNEHDSLEAEHKALWAKITRGQKKNNSELESLRQSLKEIQAKRETLNQKVRANRPELFKVNYPEAVEPQVLAASLDQQTALLAYSVTPRAAHLFIIRGQGGLQVVDLETSVKDLAEEVDGLLATLPRGEKDGKVFVQNLDFQKRQWQTLAKKLYRLLIEPAMPYLEGVNRLVIAPDGPLHKIPFATLYGTALEGREGYLVEAFI